MTQNKAMTDDKAYTSHVEKACLEPPAVVDYSGAHAKSSAEEVRLVRKLDLIILPTLWIMWQVLGQIHHRSCETFANMPTVYLTFLLCKKDTVWYSFSVLASCYISLATMAKYHSATMTV